jgi:hypothetical protein
MDEQQITWEGEGTIKRPYKPQENVEESVRKGTLEEISQLAREILDTMTTTSDKLPTKRLVNGVIYDFNGSLYTTYHAKFTHFDYGPTGLRVGPIERDCMWLWMGLIDLEYFISTATVEQGGPFKKEGPFRKKGYTLIFADIIRTYADELAFMPMRKELVSETESLAEHPENLAKLLLESYHRKDCTPPT